MAAKLGDSIYTIDSLVVRGSVNAEDFQTLWTSAYDGTLTYIDLSSADVEDNRIPDNAFYNMSKQGQHSWLELTEVILPNSITEIGDNAFAYTLIKKINLPSSLKTLGKRAFVSCYKLTSTRFVIPTGVEEIPVSCFAECQSIRKFVLPNGIKHIRESAFDSTCMTSINFPEGLESIGYGAFFGSVNLQSVSLPSTCFAIGDAAFAFCDALRSIKLPDDLGQVPNSLCQYCPNLSSINFPANLTAIASSAFVNCVSLKSISLPNLVTAIGDYAFSGTSIGELLLPASLREIGNGCFMDVAFTKITVKAQTPPQCAATAPFSTYSGLSKIPVYVPTGSAELYREASGWNVFTNFVEMEFTPEASLQSVSSPGYVRVYASIGSIVIDGITDFAVYSLPGQLVAQGVSLSGEVRVDMPSGIYLVRTAEQTHKVAVSQ